MNESKRKGRRVFLDWMRLPEVETRCLYERIWGRQETRETSRSHVSSKQFTKIHNPQKSRDLKWTETLKSHLGLKSKGFFPLHNWCRFYSVLAKISGIIFLENSLTQYVRIWFVNQKGFCGTFKPSNWDCFTQSVRVWRPAERSVVIGEMWCGVVMGDRAKRYGINLWPIEKVAGKSKI